MNKSNSCPAASAQPSVDLVQYTIVTIGGRVVCTRCTALSRRTGIQCRAVAIKGKTKCRHHGGLSTGPRTEAGRQRCAEGKRVHGRETREVRKARSQALAHLADLEALGRAVGLIRGQKTRGRKPDGNRQTELNESKCQILHDWYKEFLQFQSSFRGLDTATIHPPATVEEN